MLSMKVKHLRSSSSYSGHHVSNFSNHEKNISFEKINDNIYLQKAGHQPALGSTR